MRTCLFKHVSRLLQELNQTILSEVLPVTDALLVRTDGIVGHGRLAQGVGSELGESDGSVRHVATILQHVEIF